MSSVLSTAAPITVAETRTPGRAALPPFCALMLAGLSAVAPFIAIAFMANWPRMAFSLLGGCALALVLYGALYLVVTRGLSTSQVPGRRMSAGFALLMVGKFFLIGAAMVVLLLVWNLAAVWLLVGFLVAQIGVTAAVMKHLKSTKVTD